MTQSFVTAVLFGRRYRCPTCHGEVFRHREVKLNSTGAELFGFAWANESVSGLICLRCGNVQLFAAGTGLQIAAAPPAPGVSGVPG
jgi:hypothetical protein